MEFLSEYGLFLAKAITVVVAALVLTAGLITLSTKARHMHKDRLKIKHLNRKYDQMKLSLQSALLPKKAFKQAMKEQKKAHKAEDKEGAGDRRRMFVLDFHGDIRAAAVQDLREEITAILTAAQSGDEVLVRLESGGGVVHGYGLAASQLARLKPAGIKLTVAVDKVAASGGYMMACVADRILTAPFAIVGSIGVVAQLPNFNRLLKHHNVDYEMFTAGEFKRTVTLFGENTEKGRAKLQQDIEDMHHLFKDFIRRHRPALDVDRVATGEYWYGIRALDLGLSDELRTSDDYLLASSKEAELYEVRIRSHKPLMERIMEAGETMVGRFWR